MPIDNPNYSRGEAWYNGQCEPVKEKIAELKKEIESLEYDMEAKKQSQHILYGRKSVPSLSDAMECGYSSNAGNGEMTSQQKDFNANMESE